MEDLDDVEMRNVYKRSHPTTDEDDPSIFQDEKGRSSLKAGSTGKKSKSLESTASSPMKTGNSKSGEQRNASGTVHIDMPPRIRKMERT